LPDTPETFSAGEQSLGYFYQPRFALYEMLKLSEQTSLLIEKQDDLDFIEVGGKLTLGSLKHKAEGDKVTDLAADFWKSVRVWLASYRTQRADKDFRFYLFTTAKVEGTFSSLFLPDCEVSKKQGLAEKADKLLNAAKGEIALKAKVVFDLLDMDEKEDFLSRIVIFDSRPRIEDIPALIKDQHMRTVKSEFRVPVLQRLEGWWHDEIIKLLAGKRSDAITGTELSDKLCTIADEYKSDNLPIHFRGLQPSSIDAEGDSRLFVRQLREMIQC